MRKFLLAALLVLISTPALAQNVQCPTRPLGDSTNACASTAFVQNQLASGLPLTNGNIFVGNGSNIATPVVPSGEVSMTNAGVFTINRAITPTWTGIHTFANTVIFAPTTGLTQGFQGTQTLSGSSAISLKFNQFIISTDVTNISTGVVTSLSGTGYWFEHDFGGGAMQGGRQVMLITGNLTAPSNTSNLNHNYAALTTSMQAQTGDNGTDTGANAKGAFFGINPVVDSLFGATNLFELTGGEVNVSLRTGATARYKFGWSVVATTNDKVSAASDDAGYQLGAQTGAIGFNFGWYASLANGIFPIKAAGTFIGSAAGTVAHFIDGSNLTCSSDCWKTTGATLDGSGNWTALTYNKVTITAPGSSATLTIANTASLITSGAFALTLTATATTNSTFPAGTDTLGGLGTVQTWTKQNQHNVASTIVSATAATLDDLLVNAATTTITGNTGSPITAMSKVRIQQPTFTDASVVTLTDAATLTISGAPSCTGSLTCTNKLALNIVDGPIRMGSAAADARFIAGRYTGSFVTNLGQIYTSTTLGLVIVANPGSSFDFGFYNVGGTELIGNPTSTANLGLIDQAGGGNLSIGVTTTVTTFNSTVDSTTTSSGAIINKGGMAVNKRVFMNGLSADTASTDRTMCNSTTTNEVSTGTGALGVCLGTSGEQFKTAFAPMKAGLTEIVQLQMWNYHYIQGFGDSGARLQYGPTAQDVARVFPDLVRYNLQGEAINYDWGSVLLIGLHAIQELKADNDNVRFELEALKQKVAK